MERGRPALKTTRRAVLAGIAVTPALSVAELASAPEAPVPIFAAIEAHIEAMSGERCGPRRGALPSPTTTVSPRLPRTLEDYFPCTIETVEGPFEHIPDEFSREVLEAYRGSKCTVLRNSPVDA